MFIKLFLYNVSLVIQKQPALCTFCTFWNEVPKEQNSAEIHSAENDYSISQRFLI